MNSLHIDCDFAGKQVTCDRCKKTYTCTAASDYYCTAEAEHLCEACLVGPLPVVVLDPVRLNLAARAVTS